MGIRIEYTADVQQKLALADAKLREVDLAVISEARQKNLNYKEAKRFYVNHPDRKRAINHIKEILKYAMPIAREY